jgi:hypothetical protein
MHPGGQGKPDQFGETARPHLVHDPRAVNFDGAWADPQIVGNRFVWQSGEETFQHLKLTRRKQSEFRDCCDLRWVFFT